jgi:shikimate dehydrogenase
MPMRIGLIGYPVTHSASPRMQNSAFAATGLLNWQYELWPTLLEELPARIATIRTDPQIGGGNVTIPHKQNVMPLLDTVSPHARAIGAVNTIVKRDGRLHGDNTDWLGFLADLAWHGVDVSTLRQALVLGAGGSARGIVYALLKRGLTVSIVNRDAARAQTLARDLVALGSVKAIRAVAEAAQPDLIVNCTSAGMEPNEHTTPWPDDVAFPANAVLYDLVYKPRVTRLLQQAQSAGARAIGGLGMLVEQGAAAFELWTGVPAKQVSSVMRDALS